MAQGTLLSVIYPAETQERHARDFYASADNADREAQRLRRLPRRLAQVERIGLKDRRNVRHRNKCSIVIFYDVEL